jgi:hypothetical protein
MAPFEAHMHRTYREYRDWKRREGLDLCEFKAECNECGRWDYIPYARQRFPLRVRKHDAPFTKQYPCFELSDDFFELNGLGHMTPEQRAEFAKMAGAHLYDVFLELIDDCKHDAGLNDMRIFAVGEETMLLKPISMRNMVTGESFEFPTKCLVTIADHIEGDNYRIRRISGDAVWWGYATYDDLKQLED